MQRQTGKGDEADSPRNDETRPKSLQSMRKAHIQKVLALTGNDLEKTARILQISVSDLRRWMTKLGIE